MAWVIRIRNNRSVGSWMAGQTVSVDERTALTLSGEGYADIISQPAPVSVAVQEPVVIPSYPEPQSIIEIPVIAEEALPNIEIIEEEPQEPEKEAYIASNELEKGSPLNRSIKAPIKRGRKS